MLSWQAAPYIAAAIESILVQTFADFEFIIVDGGSTDGTPAIVESYARSDARIRLVALPDHSPRGTRANIGIAMASAPLVARMDADDISRADRFERQLAWMKARDLDICGTHAEEFGDRQGLMTFPESHDGIVVEHIFRNGMLHATTISRTELLKRFPFTDTPFEDYELWMRMLPVCRFGNLPMPLFLHRVHRQQWNAREPLVCREDLARHRFGYFYRMFPDTPLREYLPVSRMADRLPMTSLEELESAGRWLVKLSQPVDYWLRTRMLVRWRATCRLAEALGPGVEDVCKRFEEPLIAAIDAAPNNPA